jgi:transposase
MERFGVSHYVVYYWIQRGMLAARQLKSGRPYWISLDPPKERELRTWVQNSSRIVTPDDPETVL